MQIEKKGEKKAKFRVRIRNNKLEIGLRGSMCVCVCVCPHFAVHARITAALMYFFLYCSRKLQVLFTAAVAVNVGGGINGKVLTLVWSKTHVAD